MLIGSLLASEEEAAYPGPNGGGAGFPYAST